MANLLANGQYHEAVLPLPNCRFNAGCRSVLTVASDPKKKKDFNLNDEFFISGNVSGLKLHGHALAVAKTQVTDTLA